MLGSLILYLKGMRTTMFQLSGFYCRPLGFVSELGLRVQGGGFRSYLSLPNPTFLVGSYYKP